MVFVDLNRYFLPIKKDEELNLEFPRVWSKSIGGWLDWKDLLNKKRVVLLAEASSGKTEEFKNITHKLIEEGKAAFFVCIEELADEGFEQSLAPDATSVFEKWKNGFEVGYFFLDSLDEARLNQKRFNTALKKLAQKIFPSLDRSRIFISCRVTDWKGAEDEQTFKHFLLLPSSTLRWFFNSRTCRVPYRGRVDLSLGFVLENAPRSISIRLSSVLPGQERCFWQ